MGGGAETMYNQITFIFSKEWRGTILSMHLTKSHQSEKWKKKKKKNKIIIMIIRNWSLLIKIISAVPKVLFFKKTDLYTVYIIKLG